MSKIWRCGRLYKFCSEWFGRKFGQTKVTCYTVGKGICSIQGSKNLFGIRGGGGGGGGGGGQVSACTFLVALFRLVMML